MSSDISLDVIKSTQNTLGQFVKKPPLSEKLLRKPPFRFLHDIITAVIKNTGFFSGLFTEEELNSENVKDREKKIAFLQKIIQVVNLVTGTSLSVRPSKIISGQEPEKTNELLQKIGEALKQNLSSVQAVETITGGKNVTKKQNDETTKAVSRSRSDKIVTENKTKDKNDEKRLKTKPVPKPDASLKLKPKTDSVKKKKQIDVIETKDSKQKINKDNTKQIIKPENIISKIEDVEVIDETKNDSLKENISIPNNTIEINEPTIDDIKLISAFGEVFDNNKNEDDSLNTIETLDETKPINGVEFHEKAQDTITPSANEVHVERNNIINRNDAVELKHDENLPSKNKLKTDEEQKSIQKSKLPNKPVKMKNVDNETDIKKINQIEKRSFDNSDESVDHHVVKPKPSYRPTSVRPSSSRPSAPRFKDTNVDVILSADPVCKTKVNIIAENYDKQTEDDDGSIMMENSTLNDELSDPNVDKINIETASGTHGHLVQQILETQKELDAEGAKVEIEWEWGARREREASFKEIETLRNGLQTLSRAANPLGKLMDYVQEDVEIMRQELLHWRETRKKAAAIISQQENQIEKSIQPLEAKLKQLDDSILDQLELIYTVKSNIFRNDLKIKKMLNGE